jgi:hypothetical protein
MMNTSTTDLPEGWIRREPLPTDEPGLRATLFVQRAIDDITVEFFEAGEPARPAHVIEIAKDTDVLAYAEFCRTELLPEGVMIPFIDDSDTEMSMRWWKARAGTYVDVLAMARMAWPA